VTDDNELARNKDVVRRYVDEVWNGGQVDLIPELVHNSFCGHHERNRDEDIYGIEALRARVETARQHLPDLRLGVILALAEGDRVMVHLDASGTYRAPTSNQAAGQTLTFTVTGIMRVAEGRIAESWIIYDTLGALQQLGVVASLG
jgi:predicted ester cyclase